MEDTKTSYKPVEAIRRGLSLLRCLNELGIASVGDLHKSTGLHKTTIIRILETLIAEGYVTRDTCHDGYRVTPEVKTLSAGFAGKPRLVEASREHLISLTEEIKWPVSLAMIEDDQVVIFFSTSSVSIWSYPFNVLGKAVDISSSALGQCCLAFCSDSERDKLVSSICKRVDMDTDAYIETFFGQNIAQTRENGYALSKPASTQTRHQFAAVPLLDNGKFVAAICVGYYKSAISLAEIDKKLVVPMQKTAKQIMSTWQDSE